VLAALAAIAQYFQSRQLLPKGKTNDPTQAATKLMTYLFPGLTLIVALRLPAALALYWATTSAIAILQQYLVLERDVKELEEGGSKGVK
jgi:YidC/Oxa1 family membrane protein insertase